MDGLDEITETYTRTQVARKITDLMARYPYNHYVVTSRIVGYQETRLGPHFAQFKLLPFNENEIEQFIHQWYGSIACHTNQDQEQAVKNARELTESIRKNDSVLKLASNPLLVTIIAMIHYKGRELPDKRIELYEICTDTFLEHWVQSRIPGAGQLRQKENLIEVLAPIAFYIHEQKSGALIEKEEFREVFLSNFRKIHTNTSETEALDTCEIFIRFLRDQSGFFYEKGVDEQGKSYFGFMHQTFEEYLSTIQLHTCQIRQSIRLQDYIFNPRWTEVIRLTAALIRNSARGEAGRIQASRFIQEILETEDPVPEARRPLQLACLILTDNVDITDELYREIVKKTETIFSTSSSQALMRTFGKLMPELIIHSPGRYLPCQIKSWLTSGTPEVIENAGHILGESMHLPEIQQLMTEHVYPYPDRYRELLWNKKSFLIFHWMYC